MLRTVLIAEDHPICVQALTFAIHSLDSAVDVVCVDTLAAAERRVRAGGLSAVLLDLGLKDSNGLPNLSLLRSLDSSVPILVVSANDSPNVIMQAKSLCANGFLSKSAPISEMKQAIAKVLEGECYFVGLEELSADDKQSPKLPLQLLSPAQTRVMIALSRGHSNKVIAHELSLSETTIKTHLSAIYKVLGVTNRSQAILALKTAEADG